MKRVAIAFLSFFLIFILLTVAWGHITATTTSFSEGFPDAFWHSYDGKNSFDLLAFLIDLLLGCAYSYGFARFWRDPEGSSRRAAYRRRTYGDRDVQSSLDLLTDNQQPPSSVNDVLEIRKATHEHDVSIPDSRLTNNQEPPSFVDDVLEIRKARQEHDVSKPESQCDDEDPSS